MLYSKQDYKDISQTRKKLWLQLCAATAVYIITIVICSIFRISWPGYTIATIWAVFIVFMWGIRGSRIRKYYHFLKDISEGLEKNITGVVENIDSSIKIIDMLEFYLIEFRESGSSIDSPARKLYIDASLGLPKYENGNKLSLCLFGNYIKGIERL